MNEEDANRTLLREFCRGQNGSCPMTDDGIEFAITDFLAQREAE